MQATSNDLRFHTKKLPDAAMRGEEVIITFRGKPYFKIVPICNAVRDDKQNDFCGMRKNRTDMSNTEDYVRNIRFREDNRTVRTFK